MPGPVERRTEARGREFADSYDRTRYDDIDATLAAEAVDVFSVASAYVPWRRDGTLGRTPAPPRRPTDRRTALDTAEARRAVEVLGVTCESAAGANRYLRPLG